MSKHKKKKPNLHEREKIARAQHRNEYYRKIKKVLNAINCSHVYDMIPKKDMEGLYVLRFQSINISIAEGETMPPGARKQTGKVISGMMKEITTPILPGGPEIDLDTFLTAGITLMLYAESLRDDEFPKAAQIKKDMHYFSKTDQIKIDAFTKMNSIIQSAVMVFSNLNRRLYWGEIKPIVDSDKAKAYHQLIWHSVVPEKIHVEINGETHTAIRVGYCGAQSGPEWVSIKAEKLGIHTANPDKRYDVYIQTHALQRLNERIDCIYSETLLTELFISVKVAKCQREPNSGKILIDFTVVDTKAGYLLCDVIDNKIIIRTFLFLTHNGTPEGEKLRQNTGLQKEDIQFLDLDKLSTFIAPEVYNNERIRKIFTEAGCDSIFHFHEYVEEYEIPIKKHPNATLIEKYIGKEEADKFFEEEEGSY